MTQKKLADEIIDRALLAGKIRLINQNTDLKEITFFFGDSLPSIVYIVHQHFYNNFLKSTFEKNGKD